MSKRNPKGPFPIELERAIDFFRRKKVYGIVYDIGTHKNVHIIIEPSKITKDITISIDGVLHFEGKTKKAEVGRSENKYYLRVKTTGGYAAEFVVAQWENKRERWMILKYGKNLQLLSVRLSRDVLYEDELIKLIENLSKLYNL